MAEILTPAQVKLHVERTREHHSWCSIQNLGATIDALAEALNHIVRQEFGGPPYDDLTMNDEYLGRVAAWLEEPNDIQEDSLPDL